MPSPRIEIGCIGLNILVTIGEAMRVEHKLVGGEEYTAVMTFDTFGSRGIVSRGKELPAVSPSAFVIRLEIQISVFHNTQNFLEFLPQKQSFRVTLGVHCLLRNFCIIVPLPSW